MISIFSLKLKIHTLNRLLMLYAFRFDKWHLSPLLSRPYAKDVIDYLNNYGRREKLLEIGCGLGDIVRNVRFKYRLGLDREMEVIRAAKFISNIKFQQAIDFGFFCFPSDEINGFFDAIVLVNWIHNIEPSVLKAQVNKMFKNNLIKDGVIIIDTVQDVDYKFNHNVNFLTKDLICNIEKLGDYKRQREVWIIKKV